MNKTGYGNEEDFTLYQPNYVEAYLSARSHRTESIEDWTALEGKEAFAISDIYAPQEVAVALSGTENNAFAIDMTKDDWHGRFTKAVKKALIEGGLCTKADVVHLQDVRRDPIDKKSVLEIARVGVIYATVNNVRTIDMAASKTAGIGCALKTPATHSIEKEINLEKYTAEITQRMNAMALKKLSTATSMLDVERLVSKETDPTCLKHDIERMILADGGVSGLKSFSSLIETYADPAVLEAIEKGTYSEKEIAAEMTRIVLDEIAESIKAHGETMDYFYQGQVLRGLNAAPSTRTIFGKDGNTVSQRIEAVMEAYSSPVKLHRDVLERAFLHNEKLGHQLIITIKKSGCKGLKRRNRRVGHGNNSIAANSNGNVVKHSNNGLKSRRYKIHGDMYRYFEGGQNSDSLKRAYHRSHQMRGIPAHPGAIEARVSGSSLGSAKFFDDDGYTGESARYQLPREPPLNADDYDRLMRDEPPSTGFYGVQSKMPSTNASAAAVKHPEPPSLELYNASKQVAVGAEVPSLEPFVAASKTTSSIKAEVPSMEPYVVAKKKTSSTTSIASNVTSFPEVPSLEPRTYSTTTTKPIASKASVTSGGPPPLERVAKTTSALPAPLTSNVVSAVAATAPKKSSLPSLANFVSMSNAANILNGPSARLVK